VGRHELLRGVQDPVDDVLAGSVAHEQYDYRIQGDRLACVVGVHRLVGDYVGGLPVGLGLALGEESADRVAASQLLASGGEGSVLGKQVQRGGGVSVVDGGEELDEYGVTGCGSRRRSRGPA